MKFKDPRIIKIKGKQYARPFYVNIINALFSISKISKEACIGLEKLADSFTDIEEIMWRMKFEDDPFGFQKSIADGLKDDLGSSNEKENPAITSKNKSYGY